MSENLTGKIFTLRFGNAPIHSLPFGKEFKYLSPVGHLDTGCFSQTNFQSGIMKKLFLLLCLFFSVIAANAQQTFPYNGVNDQRDGIYAFTNADIYKRYNERIENGTLVIRKGKVEAIGVGVRIPPDAVVIDCTGKTIYPAFIDLFSDYGMPETSRSEGSQQPGRQTPQLLSDKPGAYSWNEALKTEFNAGEYFKTDGKEAKELRNIGFGIAMTHRMDGISRGTAALVALGEGREHEMILRERTAHVLSFDKGTSSQNYPGSLMGAIALLRQTYLDGAWYAAGGSNEEVNHSLQAWNTAQSLPTFFEVGSKLDVLRAAQIAREFGKKYIIKGGGDEYQRLEDIKATGASLILPLEFPTAYDVENPFEATKVTLADLKHWEMAPANPARVAAAGIEFALTARGLKNKSDFWANLRKAIKFGLSEEAALKALTHTPAALIGASDIAGSLEPGKVAGLIISDGNIFEKDGKILHVWAKGKPFIVKALESTDLSGTYDLTVGSDIYKMNVRGSGENRRMTISIDTSRIRVEHSQSHDMIDLSFNPSGKPMQLIRLTGIITDKTWSGKGQTPDGNWVDWKAVYTGEATGRDRGEDRDTAEVDTVIGEVVYPFLPFGWKTKPKAETVLIRNATVWTNEQEGILQNTDVLLQNGKIAQVGRNIKAPVGASTIDATGRHLTSGIIDEHTHIAVTRGVNEGTQASSAEVRIGDVLNCDDINIYRQLSGGVTAAQVLHGSANPIGGQSGIIKLRWGAAPEEMKIAGADPFIKFALGENVKQSNWGDANTIRYPQTRMGVEQVYVDHFTRAREYGNLKKSGKSYRKDLELETLLEILESKRFITCHSYVQSEINMLMKVAERFGFRVNTFTHILEGYKVADIMKAHGVGASSFSDWWAYKFEVYEAMPYNGALMHEQGLTVAYNSDDAEMARRLNQEAAKAVKYGKLPETEAWKFVTLNPAKLLHLDQRMGSIKVGKDADVVLWSDHPMSVYAKAEQTYVDGIKYFDRDVDKQLRAELAAERNRLIQKMLAEKKRGGRTRPAEGRTERLYHCDDVDEEETGHNH